jgi:hypothetical protein
MKITNARWMSAPTLCISRLRNDMKTNPKTLVACALMVLLSALCAAQNLPSSGGRPYDHFEGPFLDASKWLTTPTCSATPFVDTAASVNLLDCAREIQDDNLRLMVKAYGNSVSDAGRQFGPSELYFVNPNAVKSISTLFRVKRVDAVACPTNNTDSFGQMIFGGNYFNPGTGNPQDDVAAIIIVQHSAASSSGQLGVYALVFSPNAFYGFSVLGTANFGDLLAGNVQWDKANHRFVFSVIGPQLNASSTISYTASDTMSAAAPLKLLGARAFVPNCTTTQTSANIEILFKKVTIN